MSNQLARVNDWPKLAQAAKYQTARLAQNCKVCTRTLERFFLVEMGLSPQMWLNRLRLSEAKKLLAGGWTVKETAAKLEWTKASYFSRVFSEAFGVPPSGIRKWQKCRKRVRFSSLQKSP